MRFEVTNLVEFKELSVVLCNLINENSVVMLEGDLGVGKTTLISFIMKQLVSEKIEYTSPTFNIVHEYYSDLKKFKVFHLDLYRIKSVEELYEIGLSDMLNTGALFIEWPQISLAILKRITPERLIMIKLSFLNYDIREITITTPCNIINEELE